MRPVARAVLLVRTSRVMRFATSLLFRTVAGAGTIGGMRLALMAIAVWCSACLTPSGKRSPPNRVAVAARAFDNCGGEIEGQSPKHDVWVLDVCDVEVLCTDYEVVTCNETSRSKERARLAERKRDCPDTAPTPPQ